MLHFFVLHLRSRLLLLSHDTQTQTADTSFSLFDHDCSEVGPTGTQARMVRKGHQGIGTAFLPKTMEGILARMRSV